MQKSKKKIIVLITIILGAICCVLFAYICRQLKIRRFEARPLSDYYAVEDYEYFQEQDKKAPQGVIDVFRFQIPYGVQDDQSIVFYSVHENVLIILDSQIVYSSWMDSKNPLGKTPGDFWNELPLRMSDAGKTVEVKMTPVYKSQVGEVPNLMIGNAAKIYMALTARQVIPFSCALAAVVIGVIFVLINIINREIFTANKGLLQIGILSIIIGAWKISDLSVIRIYMEHPVEMSYRCLFLIMFISIPFALHEQELFSQKREKLLNAVAIASLIAITISVSLQVLNIADLRQTLWMHHVIIVALVIVSLYCIIMEVVEFGWDTKRKITVACFGACIVGVIADLHLYYSMHGRAMDSVAMLAFLFYIVVLGVMTIREAKNLITIGKEASDYRDMAYMDSLTGLQNRNAYAKCISDPAFVRGDCTIVMLDLNDLKNCNDTYGHEEGDEYIRIGSRIISETFGKHGDVYRLGGDEFCVILHGVSDEECQKIRIAMMEKAERCNGRGRHPFPVKIACGFLSYDKERDYDISDTMRRADHKMYENKVYMKHGKSI